VKWSTRIALLGLLLSLVATQIQQMQLRHRVEALERSTYPTGAYFTLTPGITSCLTHGLCASAQND
jgi:hypothetical protein